MHFTATRVTCSGSPVISPRDDGRDKKDKEDKDDVRFRWVTETGASLERRLRLNDVTAAVP